MNSVLIPEMIYFVSKSCTTEWNIPTQEINYYSILFVEEGSADYVINGHACTPGKGDILFLKPGTTRQAVTRGMTCIGIDFILQAEMKIDLPDLIHWGDFEDFRIPLQDLKFEWLQQNEGFELKSIACLMLILHKLIYEKKLVEKNVHVELIKKYIMENHKEDISMLMIAESVGLSSVFCGALFKKTENCTISEFLARVRINRAMILLETGEYSISATAEECGFIDIYYFSNTFKKIVGVSPSKYKKTRNVKISK